MFLKYVLIKLKREKNEKCAGCHGNCELILYQKSVLKQLIVY